MFSQETKILAKQNLYKYGADIMKSEDYLQGFKQEHHFKSTVSKHSLRVAFLSAEFGVFLSKLGLHFDMDSMVKSALLHDIGILGRFEGKYKGIKHCCLFQHPKDSIEKSYNIVNSLNKKEQNIIACHMWPFSFTFPKYLESWTIVIMDKMVAITDCFSFRRVNTKIEKSTDNEKSP